MIDHNHFICHLILGTFTEYPYFLFGRFQLFFVQKFLEFVQKIKKDEGVFSIRSSEINTLYCVFIILTPSTNISRSTFFSQ